MIDPVGCAGAICQRRRFPDPQAPPTPSVTLQNFVARATNICVASEVSLRHIVADET